MKVVLADTPDGKFYVYDEDYIGQILLSGQRWEPWVLDAVAGCADRSRSYIDAGAYIGTHTVFAAKRFSHVHAFEPYPEFAELLQWNIKLHGLTNVTVYTSALGDGSQRTVRMQNFSDLSLRGKTNLGGLSKVLQQPEEDSLYVNQNRIDSYGFKNVGVLKVDTQGTELQVLKGGIGTIRLWRPVVFVEGCQRLLEEQGDSFVGVRNFFQSLGFYNRLKRLRKNVGDFVGMPKR